jgi:hypothetical protein
MFMFVISFHGMGQAVAAACSKRKNANHFLMAHGHDRLVSSGRAATGGGTTSALGAAGGGVADLSGKGGQKPLRLLRPALRTGDGRLIFPAPEENLKGFSTFLALEFKNRHRLISFVGPQHPFAPYDRGRRQALEFYLLSGD